MWSSWNGCDIVKKIFCVLLSLLIICPPAKANALSGLEKPTLTRYQAVKMIVPLVRENRTYNTGADGFADTSDLDVAYAKAINLVYGTGDNRFLPDQPVSYQDFLLILKRGIDKAAPELFYDNTKIRSFQNEADVSAYARYGLSALTEINVLTGRDAFYPLRTITVEDALTFVGRAKDAVKNGVRSAAGVMPVKKKPKVLLYHSISVPKGVPDDYLYLYVTPENFEQQIKYLRDNNYVFLFPEELSFFDRLEKAVVLTFDDGYEDVYTDALPILEKYNAKATLFVWTDGIGKPGYCDAEELNKMSAGGVFRIYSHARTHTDLRNLSADEIIGEFSRANDIIYNITKRDVNSLAYPFGYYNNRVLEQTRMYYKTAFVCDKNSKNTAYAIKREYVDYTTGMARFIRIVKK